MQFFAVEKFVFSRVHLFDKFAYLRRLHLCNAKPAPRWQKLMKAKHRAGLIGEENKTWKKVGKQQHNPPSPPLAHTCLSCRWRQIWRQFPEIFVTNFVFVPSLSYLGRQVQNLGMFEHFISRSPLFGADTKQSFQHIPNNRPIVGHRVCQWRGSKCEECLQIINDDEASKRLKSSLSTPLGDVSE